MRRMLDQQIDNLKKEFTTMSLNVEAAIKNSLLAFAEQDLELVQEVIANDETINAQEIHLEKQCTQVIALQQPVASDLRLIIAMLKASSDLERLGDHATNIAEHVIFILDGEDIRHLRLDALPESLSKLG